MAHAEASARTVDAAVTAAAAQLGLSSDQVDIEVLEDPVPSTFGYIGTPARVRVTPRTGSPPPAPSAAAAGTSEGSPLPQPARPGTGPASRSEPVTVASSAHISSTLNDSSQTRPPDVSNFAPSSTAQRPGLDAVPASPPAAAGRSAASGSPGAEAVASSDLAAPSTTGVTASPSSDLAAPGTTGVTGGPAAAEPAASTPSAGNLAPAEPAPPTPFTGSPAPADPGAPPAPSDGAAAVTTAAMVSAASAPAPVPAAAELAGTTRSPRRTYRDEPIDPEMVEADTERAGDFLEGLLDALDVDGDITTWVDEVGGHIDLEGSDLDMLIGSNGETLDALQELTRLAVLRQSKRRVRLLLDINGFRAQHRKQLTEVVKAKAEQVIKTRQDHEFEPMTPAERKIVHDAVAAIDGAHTESLGEEPHRRVVIRPT